MPEGVECGWIRTTEELERLAPEWRGVWREDPHATPFQSPEWLLPWWRQFGQPDLRVVTLRRDGALVGLLPFYVYLEPSTGERQMLLLGVGTSDYLDGVFSPGCTREEVRAGLDQLLGEPGWDVLTVSQLRPQSKLMEAFDGPDGCRFEAEGCWRMPAVAIAELPQKIRRNVTYYRSHAVQVGRLDLRVANASEVEESFDTLQRLHTERWKSRGEPGVLTDERVPAWHREALPSLLEADMLRLCSLRLKDEVIGVLYSLIDPPFRPTRTQYLYLNAHSRDYAELSPGTLLLAFVVEQAAREGVQTIDTLRGDEAYKRMWHMERSATYGFRVSRTTRVRAVLPSSP